MRRVVPPVFISCQVQFVGRHMHLVGHNDRIVEIQNDRFFWSSVGSIQNLPTIAALRFDGARRASDELPGNGRWRVSHCAASAKHA